MRSDGLCGCVTCDSEYPPRVAFTILTKILEDFDAQNPTWKQGTYFFNFAIFEFSNFWFLIVDISMIVIMILMIAVFLR